MILRPQNSDNSNSDKVGPLNVLGPCVAISAVLTWCWIGDHIKGGIIAFCVLYGFFSGACVSITPMAIVTLSPTLNVVGARIGKAWNTLDAAFVLMRTSGQCTVLFGCGLLLGQPIAGTILSSTGLYLGTKIWCAALMSLGAAGVILARISKAGMALKTRA